MNDAEDFVAIRRKRDGLYLQGNRQWARKAQFLPRAKARLIVRIDIGKPLEDYEFLTKDEVLRSQK